MDADEYRSTLVMTHTIVAALKGLPLGEALSAQLYAESVGLMLDPTLYCNRCGRLHEDRKIVEVLHRAQKELELLF
ncbi:MAG: hypothetical protein ABFD60_01530 [Bryobacteraceae bacterium]